MAERQPALERTDGRFAPAWLARAALVALLLAAAPGLARQPRVEIRAATGHPDEQRAVHQLQRLLDEYDVERWTFTREVVLKKWEIPHSHPVLTLNSAYLDDDHAQLASFLHEQFHWYLEERRVRVDEAIAAFERMFPDAPVGNGAGARDKRSTYLHLVVCDLELRAMTVLLGEAEARRVLRGNRHYTWIYRQVLDDPRVHATNVAAGLALPDDEPVAPR
ncbi:MAG TPA: hypothetical protein VM619_15190 [Luteimonas sp.]|nr:hypothetical protein [Luteimonas sp.]